MDGVSSAAAVVSLAIQLAGTVQTIRQFLHNVETAPKELSVIVDLLDQLHQNLSHVENLIQLETSLENAPASYAALTSALVGCVKRIKTLEEFINTLRARLVRQHRLQKAWGALKVVSQKEHIQILQLQLRDALLALQMAISTNTAEVQYEHPRRVQRPRNR